MRDVIVVGGGASGMTAAIAAKRAGAKSVVLLEKGIRLGRKLASSGNGRGNICNTDLSPRCFHGSNASKIIDIISAFGFEDAREFFRSVGVEFFDENGRIYPFSLQAASVGDALRFELERLGVEIHLETAVTAINKQLEIFASCGVLRGRAVVVACGGCAAPQFGTDGSAYKFLTAHGHKLIKPLPSLVRLKTMDNDLKILRGIKLDTVLSLKINGKVALVSRGDLLFADNAVSGNAVFELSGYASRALDEGMTVVLEADFAPSLDLSSLKTLLAKRTAEFNFSADNFFVGLLNRQLGRVICKRAGCADLSSPSHTLKTDALAALIKSFCIKISGTSGFAEAQVTAGGIDLADFDGLLMSRKLSGLFACGEILDVDGDCGGFNLHWAWASGSVAGKNAASYAVDATKLFNN